MDALTDACEQASGGTKEHRAQVAIDPGRPRKVGAKV